jgi:hypothetical protein
MSEPIIAQIQGINDLSAQTAPGRLPPLDVGFY